MSVVYASPAQTIPRAPAAAQGLLHSWTGWDGSAWDLSHYAVSGAQLGKGVRGHLMPDVDEFTSESPAVDGSRFRGSRVARRDVFWPLALRADVEASFFATMRNSAPGSWAVTAPDGSTRALACRFKSVETEPEIDSARMGFGVYGIRLAADDPFWSGSPVVRTFAPGEPVDFFDPAGSPPFHISAGNLLASATMDNPGDVEGFALWRIDGPTTDVAVGVGGRVVHAPIEVPAGMHLTLDARPTARTAFLSDGTEATTQLGEADWDGTAIPPGQVVPLSLTMTGTGSVTATLTPRYLRAWG